MEEVGGAMSRLGDHPTQIPPGPEGASCNYAVHAYRCWRRNVYSRKPTVVSDNPAAGDLLARLQVQLTRRDNIVNEVLGETHGTRTPVVLSKSARYRPFSAPISWVVCSCEHVENQRRLIPSLTSYRQLLPRGPRR